jgi:carbamoyltransferase
MLVLGLCGGVDLAYQNREYLLQYPALHDSAACLVEDGRIVAAIEEERLNRIKHTNKGAVSAIRFCLDQRGVSLSDIDRILFAGDERVITDVLRRQDMEVPWQDRIDDPKRLIRDMLRQGLGEDVEEKKIRFVPHHLAHAISVYAVSGFNRCLIVTMDGGGDDWTGLALTAEGPKIETLRSLPLEDSLGLYYLGVTKFLGYSYFDEYKVMGFAPYGDPSKYREVFKKSYELLANGEYRLDMDLPGALLGVATPRKKSEPMTQAHADIAAALQESLEEILVHVLTHFRRETGHENLCLAGGVALNCTFNGKLLYSRLFDRVFIQPASHDGGLALGTALSPFLERRARASQKMEHAFLGTDIGPNEPIRETLARWSGFLDFELHHNVTKVTARLLAEGQVAGWVQGRSEFGPRALGNRSIVADPRPAKNKDIINEMVKKREAYRPFAPAVLEERARDYFDLAGEPEDYAFMTMVARVKEHQAALLGATTHVDRSARLQTVSKRTNRKFWNLIEAFGEITGVPVLLNTSFNNNAEPIVDNVTDAIVTFLTTKLDFLVVGDYLIRKKPVDNRCYQDLVPSLPMHASLTRSKCYANNGKLGDYFEIQNTIHSRFNAKVSREVFETICLADGQQPLGELFDRASVNGEARNETLREIVDLWSRRLVSLVPAN